MADDPTLDATRTEDDVADEATVAVSDETLAGDGATVSLEGLTSPTSVPVGTRLGRYVILAKLGAGAMGVVLAAYDPELDRKVALKLLAGSSRDHAGARTRLHREAQALAKLGHPNVVGVHDVGVHDGQLFVGMEFVAGKTLSEWLDEVERPRPWPEVIRVFVDAGRGLAAAHQAGLVHRDFKPDNVMLGDDGRVRVMDFGLARAGLPEANEPANEPASDQAERDQAGTDETRADEPALERSAKASLPTGSGPLLASPLTQTGTMMGTPAYMSPEQFERRTVDARSDQFGFCVALYEALYGERPFEGKTLMQLGLAVRAGKIRAPKPGSTVPAWLRRVVVRGLAPDPADRWPAMPELLTAMAEDPAMQRRKWIVGSLAIALIGGGSIGLVAAVRADANTCEGMQARLAGVWDPDRRTEVRAAIEGTSQNYAADTADRVEQRLDSYTTEWVSAREQACEATHSGEQSSELLDLRMACLDQLRGELEATVEVLATADATVVNKAIELIDALPHVDRCADVEALRAEVAPPDSAIAERVADLDATLIQALVHQRAGKYEAAIALAEAVSTDAATIGYEPLQVRAWIRLGELEADTGEYEASRTTLERARETAVGIRMWTAAAHASAILVHVVGTSLADHDAGRWWANDAKALARAAGAEIEAARYLNSFGTMLASQANHAEARAAHEQALAIWEAQPGPHPIEIAGSLNNLGTLAYAEGRYSEARAHHQRALEIREAALGPKHPDVAASLSNLGITAFSEGKYEEAQSFHERALTISEQALGPEHPDLAASLGNLGLVAKKQKRYPEAHAYLERSLTLIEAALGPKHPRVAYALTNLGNVATIEGEYVEARALHERALTIWEQSVGPEHPTVATTLNNLGTLARLEGDAEQARAHYERSLAIKFAALGPDHPSIVSAATGLGLALLDLGQPGPAVAKLDGALSIAAAHEIDPLELAETRFGLARALWDAPVDEGRDRVRSRELADQARATYADAGPESARELEAVDVWLAAAVIASAP